VVQGLDSLGYNLVPSPFGPLILLWRRTTRGPRVEQLLLPVDGEPTEDIDRVLHSLGHIRPCAEISDLAQDITRSLEGQDVAFPLEILILQRCSKFQQQVLRAEHAIPRGRVSTYGRIARHLGVPGGARAVGRALARNPFPILIPCHRVVRSDGKLGGYRGGSPMKRSLLAMEGVRISPEGRVLTDRYYY
jgi:methylated-DNA-[protein]-cysteine S-methyltransferase